MAKEVQRDSEGRPLYGGTVKVAALCVIVMQYVQSFVTPALSAVRGAYQEVGIDTVMIQQIQGIQDTTVKRRRDTSIIYYIDPSLILFFPGQHQGCLA